MAEGIFAEVWPVYAQTHSDRTTRLMHCVGPL
jgi:hypothetical protein